MTDVRGEPSPAAFRPPTSLDLMTQLSIDIREADEQHVVVAIAGELDLETAPRLRNCLRELSGQHITLDFSDVTFMDSTALGVLVAADKRAITSGGAIVLHSVQPAQMRIFEMVGLTEYLNFDGDGTPSVPL